MLIRKISTGAVWCAVLLAVLSQPASYADDSELLHRNRELVAKDYELRDGQLTVARIGLRKRQVERGWLSNLFGGVPSSRSEMEVVAYLKSGKPLLIERLSIVVEASPLYVMSAWPTIIDGEGTVVGYFRSSLTEHHSQKTHQVSFVIYLVGKNGLIRREGEAKCEYIGGEGLPNIKVANARWDPEFRELGFDLRSSCYHVELFGAGSHRTLNMIQGSFKYDSTFGKPGPWVDFGQRIIVSFDARGDTLAFEVAKADAANHRAFKKCLEEAKTDPGFRVCSSGNASRAFWRFGGDQVSYGLCANGSEDAAGKTYFVRACLEEGTDDMRSVAFNIASQEAPKGTHASIECACKRLWVDRLSFDPHLRILSFNLDTDARVIKFAGGEFQMPAVGSRLVDGRLTMQVPVFAVRFNERWQIVEMTGIGSETPAAQ